MRLNEVWYDGGDHMTSQISPTLSKEPTIVGFAFDMHHNRYHFFLLYVTSTPKDTVLFV